MTGNIFGQARFSELPAKARRRQKREQNRAEEREKVGRKQQEVPTSAHTGTAALPLMRGPLTTTNRALPRPEQPTSSAREHPANAEHWTQSFAPVSDFIPLPPDGYAGTSHRRRHGSFTTVSSLNDRPRKVKETQSAAFTFTYPVALALPGGGCAPDFRWLLHVSMAIEQDVVSDRRQVKQESN